MHSRTTTGSTSPSEQITRQAAEWLVRLSEDDMTPAEQIVMQTEFEQWKQADPRHAQAARKMESIIQNARQLQDVTKHTASARAAMESVLRKERKRSRSKNFALALILMFALFMPAWQILQYFPPAYLLADVRTATGEWKSHILMDNSHIVLNTVSAANFHFDAAERKLELVRGEILVNAAKDPLRPFIVETRHGRIRALGTRFVVSLNDQVTILSMLESRAAVHLPGQGNGGSHEVIVSAGQRVRITTQGVSGIEEIDARGISDAWQFHHLVVENRPLPEVLDELARYRTGLIRFDRAALESMRVTAVLPLDNSDRALHLLTRSFPLKIRAITSWLTLVEARTSIEYDPAISEK